MSSDVLDMFRSVMYIVASCNKNGFPLKVAYERKNIIIIDIKTCRKPNSNTSKSHFNYLQDTPNNLKLSHLQ